MTIKLDPDRILDHASHLDTAATAVNQAAGAAADVALSGDAFGLMFDFFVPEVEAFLVAEAAAIAAISPALRHLADALRKALTELEGTDTTVGVTFQTTEAGL